MSFELPKEAYRRGHWWSGWPGAFCMKCGAEHALENAIGMGWFDPYTEKWDSDEHRMEVENCDAYCPADDIEEFRKKREEMGL